MKKKKIVIFSMLIVVFLGAGLYYVVNGQKTTFGGEELSARSKEYLNNKTDSNKDSELRYVQLTGTPKDATNKKITVGTCFIIQIPFAVDNQRQKEDECHLYVSTTRPEGSIIAYQRAGEILDFDSVPGVSLRRVEKEKYEEKSVKIGNRTFLGFTNKQEGEHTYFYYTSKSYFVITFDMHGAKIDEEIKKTLQDIEFK